MDVMKEAVAVLAAEQADLEQLLRGQSDEAWLTPTPAHGWDVRDQVSHLADVEEIAYDTATAGPRQLNKEALSFESPEAFTESGCEKGRKMKPAEVLDVVGDRRGEDRGTCSRRRTRRSVCRGGSAWRRGRW